MQRQLHSSSEDFNPPVRKASLGSLTSPQPSPPRRLARTLSLRTTANEQLVNTQNNNESCEEPLRRKDYLPPTHRSLNLLNSKDTSVCRGSAASDGGDYSHRVLPPLPYNIGSQGRRRDSGRNSSYGRQHSADLLGSSYRLQHSKIQEEVVSDRPHHSTSLPSLSKGKGKKVSGSYGADSHEVPSNSDVSCPHSNNSNSDFKNASGNRSKLDKTDSSTLQLDSKVSHIPSLLRFRSSSMSRDVEKKKKDNPKKAEDGLKKPRSTSSSRSTPDRSILSKFFRQGSDEKEVNRETESLTEDKKKRRISRFLRPDFFDTPREESVYAKEKDAKKAAETENKSKSKKFTKRSESNRTLAEDTKKSVNNLAFTESTKKSENKSIVVESTNNNATVTKVESKPNESSVVAENEKIPDSFSLAVTECIVGSENKSLVSESTKKSENNATASDLVKKTRNTSVITKHAKMSDNKMPSCERTEKLENNLAVSESTQKLENSAVTERSVSDSQEVSNQIDGTNSSSVERTEKEDMKSDPNKDSEICDKQIEEQKKAKSNSKKSGTSSAFEKQSTNTNNKSRFLHSLEKKLEKFRSSGDDILSSNSSGKSRVDKAIRSLREQTLTPRGGDIITSESHLLKRAVSVSDCCTVETGLKNQVSSSKEKLGNKVTSVLGLFKKLEDKRQSSPPQSSVLSRLRRTQSVYAGSQSDGVLAESETPLTPVRIKKTNSNSAIVKKRLTKTQKNELKDSNTPEAYTQLTELLPENNIIEVNNNNCNGNNISSNTNDNKSIDNSSINQQENNLLENLKKEEFMDSKERREQASQVTDNSVNPSGNKSIRPDTLIGLTSDSIKDTAGSIDNTASALNTVDNSPLDDYSLNDDEIKFANVKRLDSCLYPADDSSVLSPADESESFDSWSICSDFENHEFPTSPIPPLGDDAEESVGDRIRRKSFYTRFNDIKKKHRKSSLSSIGSLSSSYRDPDSLSYLRNLSKKKDYISGSSHKPHRSQYLYDAYNRKSPTISPQSQQMENNSYHLGADGELNGYMNDFWTGDTSAGGEHHLAGSVETLQMPRHFNHSVGGINIPTRRASESRLSRSIESNIGTTIPKSRLPTIWDRHLTSASKLSSSSSGVSCRPDSALRLGSVAGETSLHGKYNRYNSHSPLDSPSLYSTMGENVRMELERPSTPH